MHIKRIIPILFILFCLAGIAAVPAVVSAESGIKATLLMDGVPEQITVGDPIQLTLVVEHPAGYQVLLPQLDTSWGDFIVHSQSPGTTVSNPDGTETTSQVIDVRLFAPGEFTTPPLPVAVSDSQGRLSEVTAAPLTLAITSVLVEGDTQLRDIKPQADLPYTNLLPWVIAAGLLSFGIAGIILWRRRRKAKLSLAAIDNRLPHEVALDELDRIETLQLPVSGRYKVHYTLVSDCVRVYMGKTYNFPVLERTTGEIRSSLKRTKISRDIANQFISFLDQSDLVKFSKFTPDVNSAQQLLLQGRKIVEITKPIPTGIDDSNQESSPGFPSGPGFGSNGRNPQAEVTA